jgi:hypothetical protein
MNILVCYDTQEASQKALEIGLRQAKAFGAKVFIVTSMIGGVVRILQTTVKLKPVWSMLKQL